MVVEKEEAEAEAEEEEQEEEEEEPGYRIKNKNPTQRCGEKHPKKNTPKKMHPMMMGTAFVDVKLSNYDYVSVTS